MSTRLERLTPGMPIVYGGDRVTEVSAELAAAFASGDRLVVVQTTGDLLHLPREQWETATGAVGRAHAAFGAMGAVTDEQITRFFEIFAARLADDVTFGPIAAANAADVEAAAARGRST
ncbi:MAG: glutamate-5-semialdehyde dehydrogenase, partial [Actinomycetota bacterium]|nr:glutamate-5-semialdehyde dehydrogenase [Actinomycetota bacterium]